MSRIFVSGMAYDGGKSGIGGYINEVTKELARGHEVEIALLNCDADSFPVKNVKVKRVGDFLGKPLFNMFWHLFILPFYLLFNRKRFDLIFLPAANRRVLAFYPVKTVATIHDLSQFNVEAKYDKFRMFYIKKVLPFFLKKAHSFVAVSRNTKNDVLKYYGFSPEKIAVVYNGYSPVFNKPHVKVPEKKYILYVARVEHPGKNHLNLIKAYEQMDVGLKKDYDLVFAGPLKERSEDVVEYVKKSEDAERIKFLGFVKENELADLYSQASVFVFPSFYEGFGIPLLEAMSSGVPVAASDRSSLPEIGGDAALYFNPDNPEEISKSIEKILIDRSLADELRKKGLKQVKVFNWKDHADGILKVFEGLDG